MYVVIIGKRLDIFRVFWRITIHIHNFIHQIYRLGLEYKKFSSKDIDFARNYFIVARNYLYPSDSDIYRRWRALIINSPYAKMIFSGYAR